jgi:hypothetical protein
MLWPKQSSRALALGLLANYPLARSLLRVADQASHRAQRKVLVSCILFFEHGTARNLLHCNQILPDGVDLFHRPVPAVSSDHTPQVPRLSLPHACPCDHLNNSLRAFHRVACLFAIHVFEDLLGLFDCRTLVDGRRRDELQVVAGKELGPKGAWLDKQDANVKGLKLCRKGLGQCCRKM